MSSLEKAHQLAERSQGIASQIVPVYSYLINLLSVLDEKAEILVEEVAKWKLEGKLRGLLATELESLMEVNNNKLFSYGLSIVSSPISIYERDVVETLPFNDRSLAFVLSKVTGIMSCVENEYARDYFLITLT